MGNFDHKRRAVCIMVQGTASHVGKSALAAALCRIFSLDGYRVAPFKSWNMALNSYVTKDGGEIGRAQGEQAEAAGIEATVHMNPILVKPKGPGQAQIIVRGRVHGDVGYEERSSQEYIDFSLRLIAESLAVLRTEYEIIVLEGAGSPAEINLMDQDVANMQAARLADAPVLLVSDIDRGGALAASLGTMLLLPEQDRRRVAGFIMNKFRGDKTILAPGLDVLEQRSGVPVLGVIPYLERANLAEEDGVALERASGRKENAGRLRICVLRLPHIANFTDFDLLSREPDVHLCYTDEADGLSGADAIIIPGTKNSMLDLKKIQESGLAGAVKQLAGRGVPVVGICGGYQMLGLTLEDPAGREWGGQPSVLTGLGLLAAKTKFYPEKKVTRASGATCLPFAAALAVEGYEIHMGQSEREPGCRPAFVLHDGEADGAVSDCGSHWGTYLHGVFDRCEFRRAWLNTLRCRRGWQPLEGAVGQDRAERFDELADAVRRNLDMQAVYSLLGLPGPRRGRG